MEYTNGHPAPDNYRLWSGIVCLAGAMERRLWIETARSRLFPNMFVWLVGSPAVGKSVAIAPVKELWLAAKVFKLAPDNVTKASLVDAISAAAKTSIVNPQNIVKFSSLLFPVSELGVFIAAHDMELLSLLTHVYDSPPNYREERRCLAKQIDVECPQLTMIAGTQPGFLQSLLPEEAWTQGTMSRVMMIHASQCPKVDLFKVVHADPVIFAKLVKGLEEIEQMLGKFTWDEPAMHAMQSWYAAGCPPEPEHSKLAGYCGRRALHVLKLTMVSAISRTRTLRITLDDFNRAKGWMLAAEEQMPYVFREMAGKSDIQVLDELHYFVWQMWVKNKKLVHQSYIYNFLAKTATSDKIPRLIEIAERSNRLIREPGTDLYRPRPKHEHGVE